MADTKWADMEAEEDFEPELVTSKLRGFESKPDSHGIKTVTTYTKNNRGETVKIIKRVKVIPKYQRINREVYKRANLPPFGTQQNDDNSKVVIRAIEDYFIEIPKSTRNELLRKKNDDDDYFFMDLQAKPQKDLIHKFKLLKEELGDEKDKRVDVTEATGKYIPPSMRGGYDRGRQDLHKEECTVRVTNLSEDVKEQDLTDLFGSIGKIHRIYLAKHKETKSSKGFAFITYVRREFAQKAIEKLNRHGYDNLLLNVEWAKPSTKDR